ncbi:MAG: Yip1 family protein [Asticcacaulis sp.]
MTDSLTPAPATHGLIARIQAILLKPAETWDVIDAEPSTIRSIFTGYVVPLAAVGPVCGAIGMSLIGVGMFGISYQTPWLWSIASAIVMYVCALIGVYVEALIIDALAPSFDGQKNMTQAYKVAAYSATAAWLAGLFRILPMLGVLGILGLYSLYLLYLGLPKLMKAPQEKSLGYTIVVIIVTFVLYAIIFAVGGAVAGIGAIGSMGGHMAGNTALGTVRVGGNSMDLDKMAVAASQMAAQASAMQNGTAAATEVKTVSPQALLDLMPSIYNGAVRADTSTSSSGVNGASASAAEATYHVGGGTIHLKLSDIGGVMGVGGLLNAVNVNSSSSSAGGYDSIRTDGNRKITERYDTAGKHGSYGILQDGRIAVEAEGDNVDMNTLKTLVATIDLNKAATLTH